MCRRCGEPDRRGSARNRRARKAYVLAAFGNGVQCPCIWCGTTLTFVTLQQDRLVAGGPYRRDNLVPSCGRCNIARRLDGRDPDQPDAVLPPPAWATVFVLDHIIRQAAEHTAFQTHPHPVQPDGWAIQWGAQLDIKPLRVRGDRAITDTQVAGYLAKYATKSTDATGHVSRRITDRSIRYHTDQSHPGRIIATAWELGADPEHESLRRWAHMLGFGGHFFTKSKRYSTTFKALRAARATWRRTRRHYRPDQLSEQHDDETTLVINTVDLDYAGMGWHSTGDQLLANTAAAMARERRRITREARAAIEAELVYADIA